MDDRSVSRSVSQSVSQSVSRTKLILMFTVSDLVGEVLDKKHDFADIIIQCIFVNIVEAHGRHSSSTLNGSGLSMTKGTVERERERERERETPSADLKAKIEADLHNNGRGKD